MYQTLALFFLATVITTTASAFERPFPDSAKRATMTSLSTYPTIELNKKPYKLAVGARIWNQDNRIEMPAYLQGDRFIVHYTIDLHGEVDRVWILSTAEIKKPSPATAAKQSNHQ
jgi:hypothetical protein